MNRFGYQSMSKLKGFGPAYVINLKDHTHRLKSVKEQFKKYGVSDYTVIEAVDGRTCDLSDQISGKYPKLKPSEIGCMMSHIKTIKHWLDTSESDYAIIMEDDFSFDTVEYWSWDWEYVTQNLPKRWDIVQLIMIKNEPVKFSLHKKEKYNVNTRGSYEWSTACYIINRKYAESLVKDHMLEDKYVLKNYGLQNQAADVILYSLGEAYSMPLFTHILDPKNSINKNHEDFHSKSSNHINKWWATKAKLYSKEQFFNLNEGLNHKVGQPNICFKIFHNEEDTPLMEKRNILTKRAITQLEKDFDSFDTPTIMMKNTDDIKSFYKDAKIKVDPKGWLGEGWKPGELGIWASNYTAWKNFSESTYDHIILMEDDIQLSKDFSQKLYEYIDELPEDWDVFTVYVPPTGNIRYKKDGKHLDIGKKNVCKVYQSWSCLCYVVSKSGAKKLLENVKTPVSRPIDHYLFYNDHLDVYAIKYNRANICNIYSTTSTVQHTKKQDMTGYL
jgi:GR25 family glycosyltransferase involved in LPS biosynthesis